jgi:DNA-binding response OmpR family regulator
MAAVLPAVTKRYVISHHRVLDQGVHFIQKPFSHENLAVKVREILESESKL